MLNMDLAYILFKIGLSHFYVTKAPFWGLYNQKTPQRINNHA